MSPATARRSAALEIPRDAQDVELVVAGRRVRLTNLHKPFWPELGLRKADLLQHYADVAAVLLPHLHDRPMVLKRYPQGAGGAFFFMKRAPRPRPDWIETCAVAHDEGVVDYALIQDLPALLWVVNLGCIDLNPWYSRRDDVDRPDFLHFDLDPVDGRAGFGKLRDVALLLRDALSGLGMRPWVKTTGSRGLHVYVAIARGPTQKQVWSFARLVARALERARPALVTAEYRVARRPAGRVLVDYNQNAWGRTLASVYSVRPQPRATVSTPVTWEEVERGVVTEDFRLDNLPMRLAARGDLWKPLLAPRGRFRLDNLTG